MEENNKKDLNKELNDIKNNIVNMQNDLNKDYEKEHPDAISNSIENVEQPKEEVKEEKTKKDKKKGKGPIAILLLILIVALGVGAYFYLGPNFLNKGKENKNTTEVKPDIKISDYTMSGNSLEDFDLYFLKLENEKVNKVYSPLSIKYVLEMLSEGASGETKTQLDNIIGKYEARKYTNSKNMSFANALFINDNAKDSIKEDYSTKLLTKYNAEVRYDAFNNPTNINNWIKEKTLNIIPKALDKVDSSTIFMLVNALAIDMEWQEKFMNNGKSMYVSYEHESIEGEDYSYTYWISNELFAKKFQGVSEKVSGMEIYASFNNYDIIKELGEEKIRKTVEEEYRKYIKENEDDTAYYKEQADGTNKEVLYSDLSDKELDDFIKSYLDTYIKDISENYKKSADNTDFLLYTDDNVKAFAKDLKEYDGTTLEYVGIMPTNTDLSTYINNVTKEDLNKIVSNLKSLKNENFKEGYLTIIEGYIPKFKFDYKLKLIEDLKKLGITNVFDMNKSDLSNITSSKPAYIYTAEHKATIEFTQDGIKAAAVTMMGGAGAGGGFDYTFEVPVERIDLTFDKPYMFIIRDKSTGEVWFTGTVYEPLLAKSDTSSESILGLND